jgi:hypothetical protein
LKFGESEKRLEERLTHNIEKRLAKSLDKKILQEIDGRLIATHTQSPEFRVKALFGATSMEIEIVVGPSGNFPWNWGWSCCGEIPWSKKKKYSLIYFFLFHGITTQKNFHGFYNCGFHGIKKSRSDRTFFF